MCVQETGMNGKNLRRHNSIGYLLLFSLATETLDESDNSNELAYS